MFFILENCLQGLPLKIILQLCCSFSLLISTYLKTKISKPNKTTTFKKNEHIPWENVRRQQNSSHKKVKLWLKYQRYNSPTNVVQGRASPVQQRHDMSHICKFSVVLFKNKKTSEANFNNVLLNPIYQKLSLKHVINLKLKKIAHILLKIIKIYIYI